MQCILALLAMAALAGPITAERIGDRLQVALPLVGWVCAATAGGGPELLGRYVVMFTAAHASKRLLGDAEANLRPTGRPNGFPSAHTATAVLGASAIARDCLARLPAARAAVLLSAAFVGGSRIDARQHDIWQVAAGAALGWGCEAGLRGNTRARHALAGFLRNLRRRALIQVYLPVRTAFGRWLAASRRRDLMERMTRWT